METFEVAAHVLCPGMSSLLVDTMMKKWLRPCAQSHVIPQYLSHVWTPPF